MNSGIWSQWANYLTHYSFILSVLPFILLFKLFNPLLFYIFSCFIFYSSYSSIIKEPIFKKNQTNFIRKKIMRSLIFFCYFFLTIHEIFAIQWNREWQEKFQLGGVRRNLYVFSGYNLVIKSERIIQRKKFVSIKEWYSFKGSPFSCLTKMCLSYWRSVREMMRKQLPNTS